MGAAKTRYQEKLRELSERIVELQRPIRVLDTIKWDPAIDEAFARSGCRELPKVDAAYYAGNPLSFDADAQRRELRELIREIGKLDAADGLSGILLAMAEQYHDVIEMLLARGTPRFGELSSKLYGAPSDSIHGDTNSIRDLGYLLYQILAGLEDHELGPAYPEDVTAEAVVDELNLRFRKYFKGDEIAARLSDGIVADASAGADVVKIKEGAMFSTRDIDILEVHEGWVHVGTTQNGKRQETAKWLSKGPPRCASTQEGLAVIMEIFTFRSYPRRARQINDRILGIAQAQGGADFLEVFEFYRVQGYSEEECYTNAKRVFRGGVITGGAPFTKDIAYCKGFIENYNFMRAAIRAGRPYLIPYLFAGKLHVDDVPLLYRAAQEGIVDGPKYLPPQFRDLNGVAVWMSFSSFLNQVDLRRIQEHYDGLFARYL